MLERKPSHYKGSYFEHKTAVLERWRGYGHDNHDIYDNEISLSLSLSIYLSLSLPLSLHIYIYIYIYVSLSLYIYIYNTHTHLFSLIGTESRRQGVIVDYDILIVKTVII